MPDLLEAAAARQLGGVVASVVEETLLATHVTNRRLGDSDTLQTTGRQLGRSGAGGAHLLDLRNAHDVAYGEDAGHAGAVDPPLGHD